jgi:hypothetical protein
MSTDDTTTLDTSVLAALSDSVGGDDAFVADLVEYWRTARSSSRRSMKVRSSE